MTAGFFSPLPPARTGVADYSAALLRGLQRRGTFEIAARNADINLYHLGNNQIHREIYLRALAQPGVVVLHDAVLQHFFLGSLNREQYVEEFVFNYGEWRRSLGLDLWRNRASSGLNAQYFFYPMLKRIAQVSRAVIVHNPAAAALVRAHALEARVIEIPHLFNPPEMPHPVSMLQFRAAHGIAPGAFLFGVFGYLRESKRLLPVLRCFETLHRARPNTALLIAGQFVSSDLARNVEPLLSYPGVARVGHLGEREFTVAAAAVDACINLRYPSAAETSGIAIRLMGLDKPVLMSRGLENSNYPSGGYFGIESGLAEQSDLLDHMTLAASFPELARDVGRRGGRHVRRLHALDQVAEQYWET
ncbi:MAG: hypothetical protein M3Z36_02165, partial [Acidobacteriota bacterium]|nr:hypothetical protein [Acidobacteriota bacterium]